MNIRRNKVRTGAKKLETLLRTAHKTQDDAGCGPRNSGQKWERANKKVNDANSATEQRPFV